MQGKFTYIAVLGGVFMLSPFAINDVGQFAIGAGSAMIVSLKASTNALPMASVMADYAVFPVSIFSKIFIIF